MNESQNQMRFTEDELRMIRDTFKGNTPLLRLVRKFFLPPIDLNSPMGLLIDIYNAIPADNLPDQQVANLVRSRNMLVSHLNRMFMELEILANMKEESPKEKEVRIRKDSVK